MLPELCYILYIAFVLGFEKVLQVDSVLRTFLSTQNTFGVWLPLDDLELNPQKTPLYTTILIKRQ